MNNDEKELLSKYLSSQKLMSLATSDGKGNLWSAFVYFLFDDDLNFYFLSSPKTLHCQNIEKHSKVSMVIADSSQKLSDEKCGVQIAGVCKKVNSLSQIKLALKMWKRLGVGSEDLKLSDIKERGGYKFYKITPTKIKIFEEKGEEKETVFDLD